MADKSNHLSETFLLKLRCRISDSLNLHECHINLAKFPSDFFHVREVIISKSDIIFNQQNVWDIKGNCIFCTGLSFRSDRAVNISVNAYTCVEEVGNQKESYPGGARIQVDDCQNRPLNINLKCDDKVDVIFAEDSKATSLKITGTCRGLYLSNNSEESRRQISVDAKEFSAKSADISGALNFHCKKETEFYKFWLEYPVVHDKNVIVSAD